MPEFSSPFATDTPSFYASSPLAAAIVLRLRHMVALLSMLMLYTLDISSFDAFRYIQLRLADDVRLSDVIVITLSFFRQLRRYA